MRRRYTTFSCSGRMQRGHSMMMDHAFALRHTGIRVNCIVYHHYYHYYDDQLNSWQCVRRLLRVQWEQRLQRVRCVVERLEQQRWLWRVCFVLDDQQRLCVFSELGERELLVVRLAIRERLWHHGVVVRERRVRLERGEEGRVHVCTRINRRRGEFVVLALDNVTYGEW